LRLAFTGTGLFGSFFDVGLEKIYEELEDIGSEGPRVHIVIDDSQKKPRRRIPPKRDES